MVKIEDFSKPKYLDYGKVFLVLYFKGFSWKKELQNEFNISNSIVSKALQILEENGYVIAKDFWSLELDAQEAIKRLNAGYSYLLKSHPKIYTLSIEGKEEGGYAILDDLNERAKTNSSLQATIQFIKDKTKAYNILLKEFDELENTQFSRKRIDHSTGVLYETPTKKQKQFKFELKKALEDIKLEKLENKKQNLLSSDEKKELVVLQKNKEVTRKREIESTQKKYKKKDYNKNLYNGQEIGNIEFDEKLKKENIDDEPTKIGIDLVEVEKEHAINFNELREKLGIDVEEFNYRNKKELEICEEVIKQIKKKGWMDAFAVQRMCRSPKVFRLFIKLAEENNIFDDGEDFRYVKN